MSNAYESGMTITYDPVSKRVVIAFRGRITVLPGAYDTEPAGVAAAEAFCRLKGWHPQAHGNENERVRTPW